MLDSFDTHEEKSAYAREHSLLLNSGNDTFIISCARDDAWGGVIDHIESVFPITAGNLMIAMTAIPGKFCISFQQVVRNDKYLKHFLDILDEENIGYSVGEMEEKKLPLDPVI